jgi:hypothetical protein
LLFKSFGGLQPWPQCKTGTFTTRCLSRTITVGVCWLEEIAVGFVSTGGFVEWRTCYPTVEEGVFEGVFDSRVDYAAFCGWAVADDALLL